MKIVFRVDASSRIGTGHFMRCLALADALKQQGTAIHFACRHLPQHLSGLLATRQYAFNLLESAQTDASPDELPHASWLGVSQANDATDTMRVLSGVDWDWLVVDHYALDARWESVFRGAAGKIMVIDDLANRRHDCDLLLDQNYYTDGDSRYAGKVRPDSLLLLGPRYALLRDEFQQLRVGVKLRNGPAKRLLIFFGGVDADNLTGCAIEALAGIGMAGLDVDVVIGAQHPEREQIATVCAGLGWDCHIQTDKLAVLMAEADLAIGAGGTATWERCCLGLPAIVFCTADNQKKQIADAAQAGLLYSPDINDDLGSVMQRHLRALTENVFLRQHISANSMQIADGLGARRVATEMLSANIEMRLAQAGDSEKIFEWRNHPGIREVSGNPGLIDWHTHQRWFAEVQSDTDKILLIGRLSGLPVGVVRFDVQGDEAEISIYLVPDGTTVGLGRGLVQSAEQWLAHHRAQVRKIRAHILGANMRSKKMFFRAGYHVEETCYVKVMDR